MGIFCCCLRRHFAIDCPNHHHRRPLVELLDYSIWLVGWLVDSKIACRLANPTIVPIAAPRTAVAISNLARTNRHVAAIDESISKHPIQ